MSELRVETRIMPAAELGEPNPLPALRPLVTSNCPLQIDSSVPEEHLRYIDYGVGSCCLPYRMQDNYNRDRRPRGIKTAVLENDVLRATFLLELGGRLWSLYHKVANRELLYVNPVFQPGNLALRNAWFSGGVEWNFGISGHSPLTCSPMFAARVTADDGSPVLRLYEYERIRNAPYQMDFFLPDGCPFLLVRVRLINPHDVTIPMWWWSNIAVPEKPDVRVLVPADWAYHFGYTNRMKRLSVPIADGTDQTYPCNLPQAGDFFYGIEEDQWPWIAALDDEGKGLIQASTARLRWRKLFVWGMSAGGRKWTEFLSQPDNPYIELQAGLARTQRECVPMPPQAEWTWLEAYGLMEADPGVVHGRDWSKACAEVESCLTRSISRDWLEDRLTTTGDVAAREPEQILHRGSGWGALERRRREKSGQAALGVLSMRFDDESLGPDQQPWLNLLENGHLPYRRPDETPGAWMIQRQWRQMLEQSVRRKATDHWLAWLHLGVMYYGANDMEAARQAWQRSIAMEPSAWAYRNLAVVAHKQGDLSKAADLLLKACEMMPNLRALCVECCEALCEAGRAKEALDLIRAAPEEVRTHGRIRILKAQAARECETTLTDLWFGLHEKRLARQRNCPIDEQLKQYVRQQYPPPEWLDFRMARDETPVSANLAANDGQS